MNKQIWRTTIIPRPEGLTPAKERKEVDRLADAWEEEQKALYQKELKGHRKADASKITLSDFIVNHWLEHHVNDGKHTPDTISFYTFMGEDIRDYFEQARPGIKLKDVEKEDVLEYLAWMRKDALTKRGKPYSAATIKHHFSTLRNILEYAVYTDYIKEDPCTKIKNEDRPKREDKEIDFLDENDAIAFLAALDSDKEKEYQQTVENHLYWKCMVNVLITTGFRRGELVGLQWGDIDKKNLMLTVRRNITPDTTNKGEIDPEKKIHIGTTKGKKIRTAPISKYLYDLLMEFKAAQDAVYGTLLPSAYIFCRADNPYLPLYPTEPTRRMAKFIRRHKLPNVSPHDLRHTAATLAIESGASVKEIQALLGHKDAATTLKFYAGITEKTRRQTVEGIESLIRPRAKDNQKAE